MIFFFFNDTAPTEIYTLSLHDALPISDSYAGHGHGAGSYCAALGIVRANATGGDRRRLHLLGQFREQRSTNRSEEHTSELQSLTNLVCRLLLEKKKTSELSGTAADNST